MSDDLNKNTTQGKIDDFQNKSQTLKLMGGEKQIAKQHESKKLTARERLDLFFDKDTFQEVQLFVEHRSTLFGLDKKEIPADGVISGFGKVNGRIVFVAAQDFTASGGSLGEMHAKKIWKVMDMAIAAQKPFVALNDSGGARIQEGVPSLEGYGGIFYRNTIASGYIPQITAIMGPTAGGAVYSPALADWVFMVKGSSFMYITGPDVIKAVIGEEVSHDDLGGAVTHATKSGVCHFVTETDAECIEKIKQLLAFLPDSCHSPLPLSDCTDNAERVCTELDAIIPDKGNRAYDMKKVIKSVSDNNEMFELLELWAQNIIISFIRIMGKPVGVIANNPRFAAGVLNVDASDKASRFIRFCDAFNIPLLTFTDVPGYMPGTNQEWAGIIRHGAKLLHAYSEATVPKITVITRKAYGGAYIGMCSKQLGADYVMAWPTAEIAVMGAEGACNIIYRNEISAASDPAAKRTELVAAYEDKFNNPYFAASMGIIEEIIAPRDTRKRIIALLDALKDKKKRECPRSTATFLFKYFEADVYNILADAIVVAHFLFIAFVICGGLLVIRWPRIAFVHLPAAVWGAIVEIFGWICPLTPLENHFRNLTGDSSYSGDFIFRYLIPVIYPENLTNTLQQVLGLLVILINIIFYVIAIRTKHLCE